MNTATAREVAFTDFLANLVQQENRAALADLRRGLGKAPGTAVEMFPYVMPFIHDTAPTWRQDDYFLVASLFAIHQLIWVSAEEGDRDNNMGASFRLLDLTIKRAGGRPLDEKSSIEKRFGALVAAERADLPEHLRHAVSLLKAHNIPIKWSQLLHDLAGWNAERRYVQLAWAQAFWRLPPV